MNELVSIVIPVYNVDKYIRECLDSVINQSYKNLQIILVDDGSTDNSGKICDEYAVKDSRITVIHQENQGAGAAKNTGLDLVKGEYLSLIDSDDYLELNYYETMVSNLKRYNVDVVQCLFRNVFVNNKYDVQYNFPSQGSRAISAKRFLTEMLYDWKYAVFWNKLFKSKLLKDIRFPVGRKIDDEFFTYKLICNAKKILNINDKLYSYRMRQSSVMNNSDNEQIYMDRIDCFIERLSFIEKLYPSLTHNYKAHIADYIQTTLNDSLIKNEFKSYLHEKALLFPVEKESMVQKVKSKVLFHKCISNANMFVLEKEECYN